MTRQFVDPNEAAAAALENKQVFILVRASFNIQRYVH